MRGYFITVLNMSMTATYVAITVMAVRLLIKKAPKIFSYFLWAVVFFRLISPVSFKSSFSLMTRKMETLAIDKIDLQNSVPKGDLGVVQNVVNQPIQSSLASTGSVASLNYTGIITEVAAVIWLLGIAVLLCYGAVSYFGLKRRLATATLLKGNVFETDRIKSPFVLGFISPKIYLPVGLHKNELGYILKHEETHIKRLDYLIKPAAFLALTLHWFNPVIWLSYILMARDMEMSCDERVIKGAGEDIRVSYSSSMLSLSVRQSGLLTPLAFGESSVKFRIKNVLNYKKTPFWIVIAAIVAVVAIIFGLMANPTKATTKVNVIKRGSVESFAWEIIKRDIERYESNPDVKIIDSKITRLELVEKFHKLADKPIEVYALEYRLKPEDLSKIPMAGGMQADENGWLKETASMGSPLLVVYQTNDSFEFIGTLTTGGVIEEGGLEELIKGLISKNLNEYEDRAKAFQEMADKGEMQWLLSPESAAEIALGLKGGHFPNTKKEIKEVTLEYSYEYQKVIIEMYQPVKKGEGGIWVVKSHRAEDLKEKSSEVALMEKKDLKGLNINYIDNKSKKKFVEKQRSLLALPTDNAAALNIIGEGTVIDVLDTASVDNVIWIYISIPTYDSPTNSKGWIKEADTLPYTKNLINNVKSDVKIKKDEYIYETDSFNNIQSVEPYKALGHEHGRILAKKEGYMMLQCAGGNAVWVKESSIIYPEVE